MKSVKLQYTFKDMKMMDHTQLGDRIPLELFRTIRLIGLDQDLPLGGKGTTLTGIPRIVHSDKQNKHSRGIKQIIESRD